MHWGLWSSSRRTKKYELLLITLSCIEFVAQTALSYVAFVDFPKFYVLFCQF